MSLSSGARALARFTVRLTSALAPPTIRGHSDRLCGLKSALRSGSRFWLVCSLHIALLGIGLPAQSAQNDNNIEWNGVYSDETLRVPRSPARGQAFTVDLRVFRGDITAARVR